jgi:hypothetical protein
VPDLPGYDRIAFTGVCARAGRRAGRQVTGGRKRNISVDQVRCVSTGAWMLSATSSRPAGRRMCSGATAGRESPGPIARHTDWYLAGDGVKRLAFAVAHVPGSRALPEMLVQLHVQRGLQDRVVSPVSSPLGSVGSMSWVRVAPTSWSANADRSGATGRRSSCTSVIFAAVRDLPRAHVRKPWRSRRARLKIPDGSWSGSVALSVRGTQDTV